MKIFLLPLCDGTYLEIPNRTFCKKKLLEKTIKNPSLICPSTSILGAQEHKAQCAQGLSVIVASRLSSPGSHAKRSLLEQATTPPYK